MFVLYFLIGFCGMEAASWAIHKYLMHGILWKIHQTHHQKQKSFFELNDIFSVIFASISIVLIVLGAKTWDFRFWIGLGIAIYGFVYFILHDLMIHSRIKLLRKSENWYLQAITKAHQKHHQSNQKESESFGLLIVAKKFFIRSNKS